MNKTIKKAAAVLTLCAMSLCRVLPVFAYDISVRMDRVARDESYDVDFGAVAPVQLDSRTLVPARAMAESAGMSVTWDQPTQTAILFLKPSADSDKPVERYAAKVFDRIPPPLPNLSPVDMTAALKLDSGVAVIRYNYIDSDGEYINYGKEYKLTSKTILVDDGTLMLPLRDSMEIFGLTVGWNQDEMRAYISVPDSVNVPDNLAIIPDNGEGKYAATTNNKRNYISYSYEDIKNGGDGLSYIESKGTYLGTFRITHYCPCEICNEGWGPYTAWAGEIIPGQTIGVNPKEIPPLSWVYIEGYGLRRAEDTGGGIGTKHIDMAVENHQVVQSMDTVYRDVYLVSTP